MKELTQMIYEKFVNTKVNLEKRLQQEKVIQAENRLLDGLCDEKKKEYRKLEHELMLCEDMEVKRAIKFTLKLMKEIYKN